MIVVEQQGDTLILMPKCDLRELEYQEIEREAEAVLGRLAADGSIRNVVVVFSKTDYFGSTALGLLVRLRHEVRGRNGRMALCNISTHEKDIFEVTGTDALWPIFPSREEAIAAVTGCVRAA
jgi:anti-anti-sigma factor